MTSFQLKSLRVVFKVFDSNEMRSYTQEEVGDEMGITI